MGSGIRTNYSEKFERPNKDIVEGIKKNQSYDHLDENGLPRVGYKLTGCQPVIGKTTITKVTVDDEKREVRKDSSKYLDDDEDGIVDSVFMGKNEDGLEIRKVKLRQTRIPEVGDKFCCLPTQQVLTDKGWLEIKDIDIKIHKLLTIDEKGNLLYEYPTAKYEFDHDDKMYYIKNKQVHIICTLNHKLYVKTRYGTNYKLLEAKEIMGKMVRFKKNMVNKNICIDSITFENKKYDMNYWLRLLGMFIADGCCSNNYIYIAALKERKVEFNKCTLNNLNIEFSYLKDGKFSISGSKYPEIYNELNNLNVGALKKYLPEYVWNLSEKQSLILLDSLLEGDGHTYEYKNEDSFSRYGTISLQLANDISKLAVHCGFSGIIKISDEPDGKERVGKRNLGSRAGEEVKVTQKNTYYKISIIRKQNEPWINKKNNESNEEKLIDYKGKVFCVEMPTSHTYYMRENTFSPSLIIGNSSRHGQLGRSDRVKVYC